MKNCIDEGTLQAWFDGELPANKAAEIAAHLNACASCAETARTVEAENLLLSEGLAVEFAAPIPSERLRERLDAVVAGRQATTVGIRQSRRNPVAEFFASFRPLAYASVAAMILLAAIIGFVYFKHQERTSIAIGSNPAAVTPAPKQSPEQIVQRNLDEVPNPLPATSPQLTQVSYKSKAQPRTKAFEPHATSLSWPEQQYKYAIAKLNEAIKIQPPLKPSALVEYEYNMAVIDNEIAAGRAAAKKNPKDPQAAQSVLTAYQNKIDLMNQIADARVLK
ncbi:MAG TPA: zf-HC2 domain-containing protein [Pyrinomonadaceae bacterium]|jgi:PIN domain nuclease of toxin-antitoxin system|nr:zf-HC2 domain-containing protein [Pyrinomonadaceae bacterium]